MAASFTRLKKWRIRNVPTMATLLLSVNGETGSRVVQA